jgi:hypothetical protein
MAHNEAAIRARNPGAISAAAPFPSPHGVEGRPATPGNGQGAPSGSGAATTLLRYSETSPVRVVGPVTGRNYAFSGSAPVQAVAAQDAEALVATRFFRRV